MDSNEEIKVYPKAEVDAAMDGIKSDVATLTAQMAENKEATGLEIEKRGDDLKTALDAVEGFSERMDEVSKKVEANAYAAQFGETGAELKTAISQFGTGFREFDGDKDASEVSGRPSMKHLVEGAFVAGDDNTFLAPKHVAIDRLQKP